MVLIEQAVFTSARTERAAGYQLAAVSPGVSDDDARALTAWGPSHDALLESGAPSVNFHPLPSGKHCVSRTTASGSEYSGRGARIYTQCLLVDSDIFRRFGNNPFALLRAASGSGILRQYTEVPKRLEPVPLVGRAPVVDSALLARVLREIGPESIASMLQAALTCQSMALVGAPAGEQAVAALLNCLPPDCRTEFPFSTGLRFSARRPFRVVALSTDAVEQRRVRRIYDLAVIDLSGDVSNDHPPVDIWPQAILRVLKTGRAALLNRHFAEDRVNLTLADLDALGLELLEELEGTPIKAADAASTSSFLGDRAAAHQEATSAEAGSPAEALLPLPPVQMADAAADHQAHGPHPGFAPQPSPGPGDEARLPGPSGSFASDDPAVLAKLEELDDLVFGSIQGDRQSLSRLQQAWPQVRDELGDDLLGESREQYLGYALSLWEQSVRSGEVRPTEHAVTALEVLCLLFDEV